MLIVSLWMVSYYNFAIYGLSMVIRGIDIDTMVDVVSGVTGC